MLACIQFIFTTKGYIGNAQTSVNFGDLDLIFKVTTAKFVLELANSCVHNNLRTISWISFIFETKVSIRNVQTLVYFGDLGSIFKVTTNKFVIDRF